MSKDLLEESSNNEVEAVTGEVVDDKEATWRPEDADREEIKYYIRQRVNNATVPEGTIFRKAKPKPSINDTDEKVVAVYARVSTKSTEQVSSIENQSRYYREKIANTPNWNMSKIYADEGKSGTSMKKRTAFKEMLQDAMDKKMDLILCASVSRFARNMSDCMDQISNLKTTNPSHPVGVYFETENLYTLDPDCDQALSIHAMLADWESANKSRRMILSYDQRICTGQYPVSDLLGYRHTKDGNLLIQEDEALTVEYIFLAKANGATLTDIAEVLTDKERKTLTGRTEWNEGMVRNILNNERRWGDLEARKTIVIDYKKGKTVKNVDIRDSAYVPNHHEAIVSREIAKAAQVALPGAGVPELKVVEQGILKGFVSVYPSFTGINTEIILDLCSSAYSDEEYRRVKSEEKIINNEEHSKVLSMDFTGYCVPNSAFFIDRSTPTLTITQKDFKFNQKCMEKLDDCEYIEILYHPVLQIIVVRQSESDNVNAVCWKEFDKNILRFPSKVLSGAIYDQMDWIKEYGFRFRGITKTRGNKKMMVFFLDEPQIILSKKAKEALENPNEKYIPYRNFEVDNTSVKLSNQIGMNYHLRKRRNKIVDLITENDLNQGAVTHTNPLIGVLPSRKEMEDKIEELMMIM